MSLSIRTNITALSVNQKLSANSSRIKNSIERLSSGSGIVRASDDASGMSIADSLKSQRMGLGQAARNASDGISILQIAEGALKESADILNTIKVKSIQAASDGQTLETRQVIQSDINKLLQEFDTIAQSTSFNGQKLLSGMFSNREFQVGSGTGEIVRISMNSAESTKVGHTSVAEVLPDYTRPIFTTLHDKESGADIVLDAFQIRYDNTPENGIGALADQINRFEEKTDVKAFPVVRSESNIFPGTTGDDFKINGIPIGNLEILGNDSDGRLVKAINSLSGETGVTAGVYADGKLELVSMDGRAIKVEGLPIPEVISSSQLTTHGYLKMVSRNFGQYDITQSYTETVPSSTPLTSIPSIEVLNSIPTNTFMTWSSATSGSGGGISAVVTSTINQGSLSTMSMSATDPYFISKFSSDYPVLHYDTLTPPPADISSTFSFSSPLPIGSKLFIVDVDQGQTFTLTSSGTPLVLLDQIKSKSGTDPAFPTYNSATGELVSDPGGTDREVSVFDLSNKSSIDVQFKGGSGGTDVFLAISLPNSSPENPAVGYEEITTFKSIVSDPELLRLCDINVTTPDDAQIAMELADVSLQDIDRTRSNIGSVQNQLEATCSNISSTMVQLASSESDIRDLDFSNESGVFTKMNIMQQAGTFALSQSNTIKKNLLNLLE